MSGRLVLLLLLTALFSTPGQAANRCVLVWLEGEPLAEVHARNRIPIPGFMQPLRLDSREMADHRARLQWQREAVHDQLRQLGFVRDADTDVVLHTLIGRMPAQNIEAANSIPGVRLVRAARTYKRHLDAAVPLVRADSAWMVVGGEQKAGRGIKIGIIDTGIDLTHPMLQDSTLPIPAGFPKGERALTNSKVIVARNYVSLLGDPRLDQNALDEDGHGTSVAAIAAGRRAVSPFGSLAGVAPGAYLGNYRISVFGETLETSIIAALNDATADGMNVINVSFGGAAYDVTSLEPVPLAIAAAVEAGLVVVVAAGNECDTPPCPGTVGDPASAPTAVTVGATTNSRILAYAASVSGSGVPDSLQRIPAVAADRQMPAGPIGPAAVARPTSASSNACKALTSTEDVRGKIVLFTGGTGCSRSVQIKNLADSGVVAALYYVSNSSDPPYTFSYTDPTAGAPMEPAAPPIPSFMLWGSDGKALNDLLAQPAPPQIQLAIDSTGTSFPLGADQMAYFSSRGPSIDNEVKPDLVAPGFWIYSAAQGNNVGGAAYNSSEFTAGDGTSLSSPMVAGAAALVKQAHPTWTPAQVKSALASRAVAAANEGAQTAPILASGAGRLDVGRSLSSVAALDPVSISFGSWYVGNQVTATRKLTITNLGAAAESYSVEVSVRKALSNASVSVQPPQTSSVAPGASATVQVTFQGPPSVSGSALIDGRLKIHANNSGEDYLAPFWGQVMDASRVRGSARNRGNGQQGPVSTVLPSQLGLLVYDADLLGVGGVPVHFEITDGGGALSASDVTTDTAGWAAVSLRLPDTPGVVHVKASLPSNFTSRSSPIVPRSFTVTARAVEPKLTRFLPPGFYIVEATLAPGASPGLWGLEVLTSLGEAAGGFNLGGAVPAAKSNPGFGAFAVSAAQTVTATLDAQPPRGTTLEMRFLDGNRQQIGSPVSGSAPLTVTKSLVPGFYIVEVWNSAPVPVTYQLGLAGSVFSGGIDAGGYLDAGVVGFGAFYVAQAQDVKIMLCGHATYGSGGAGKMILTLKDSQRNVLQVMGP
jgi:subtilisin family serine protease